MLKRFEMTVHITYLPVSFPESVHPHFSTTEEARVHHPFPHLLPLLRDSDWSILYPCLRSREGVHDAVQQVGRHEQRIVLSEFGCWQVCGGLLIIEISNQTHFKNVLYFSIYKEAYGFYG